MDALHSLTSGIEESIKHKEIALGILMDIEGAFDNATFQSIEKEEIQKGIDLPAIRWIKSMLESRTISAGIRSTSER